MEVEIPGLGTGLILLAVGLAFVGYFIGKGLQNIGEPDKDNYNYNLFIKENDLEFYSNLNKKEVQELLNKYPDAPKIELNGTTYYPYKQFLEWLSSIEANEK
ncbi:DNA-binding protein [Lentibacillus sp. CBA3610]|uniref:DNA-binding protein n=1 Tax=Lentibacillus sp. CBA3610 TaxID=2518176 RepID=UPI001595CC2C|nr:DNA-binding protein [Lentibacillus sp. CBA3610]QKY69395.1 DNA-binding protein [Lentibacillus sp. CBA3610]